MESRVRGMTVLPAAGEWVSGEWVVGEWVSG